MKNGSIDFSFTLKHYNTYLLYHRYDVMNTLNDSILYILPSGSISNEDRKIVYTLKNDLITVLMFQ